MAGKGAWRRNMKIDVGACKVAQQPLACQQHSAQRAPVSPLKVVPDRALKVSQMLGPRPSAVE